MSIKIDTRSDTMDALQAISSSPGSPRARVVPTLFLLTFGVANPLLYTRVRIRCGLVRGDVQVERKRYMELQMDSRDPQYLYYVLVPASLENDFPWLSKHPEGILWLSFTQVNVLTQEEEAFEEFKFNRSPAFRPSLDKLLGEPL